MNAKLVLVALGSLLLVAGIALADTFGSGAWAVGIAIGGIVATILVAALLLALARHETGIVILVLAEFVAIAVILNGGVADLILYALYGYVIWKITLAAALAGFGGILLAFGLQPK